MGRIISEDATNIFFPQTCDVLVDDVDRCLVRSIHVVMRIVGGKRRLAHTVVDHFTNETKIYGKLVHGC